MIIIEDRLREMFEYLPNMSRFDNTGSFKPKFQFGDGKELNAFLDSTRIEKTDPYPLIWLLYPQKEVHSTNRVKVNNMTIILAVKTTPDKMNEERFEKVFKPILFPLADNIFELFKKSNTIDTVVDYDVIKYPNYGELNTLRTKEQNFTTDIWDALRITFNANINNNCLRQLNFNTQNE